MVRSGAYSRRAGSCEAIARRSSAYTGKQFFFAGYLHQGGVYEVFAFNVPGYSLELAIANGRICD